MFKLGLGLFSLAYCLKKTCYGKFEKKYYDMNLTCCYSGGLLILFFLTLVFKEESEETLFFFSWGSEYSSSLVLLSLWLGALSGLVGRPLMGEEAYLLALTFVVGASSMAFLSSNGFSFYCWFEMTFFPVIYIILLWGYNRERIIAVYYMMLYAVVGGLYHLLALVSTVDSIGGLDFSGGLAFSKDNVLWDEIWYSMLMAVFLFKSPLFLSHSWLTKAHVEAPTGASMVLAGILLKLGSFGIFSYSRVIQVSNYWSSVVQAIGLWGSLLVALACIRAMNAKFLVAESSVVHMSLGVLTIFCSWEVSQDSVWLNCLSHGLTASGLFGWCGLLFKYQASLNIACLGGQRYLQASLGLLVFCLLCSNCSVPPFFSFWAETFSFSSLVSKWVGLYFFLIYLSVLCLAYNIILGVFICQQELAKGKGVVHSWGTVEGLGVGAHVLPGIFLFFAPLVLE